MAWTTTQRANAAQSIQDAAAAFWWPGQPIPIEFVYDGLVTATPSCSPSCSQSSSFVEFIASTDPRACIPAGLAGRTFWRYDCATPKFNLFINITNYTWNLGNGAPGTGQQDLIGVATHEFGHTLNLDHADNQAWKPTLLRNNTRTLGYPNDTWTHPFGEDLRPTMWSNGVPGGGPTAIEARTLEADDLGGLYMLYYAGTHEHNVSISQGTYGNNARLIKSYANPHSDNLEASGNGLSVYPHFSYFDTEAYVDVGGTFVAGYDYVTFHGSLSDAQQLIGLEYGDVFYDLSPVANTTRGNMYEMSHLPLGIVLSGENNTDPWATVSQANPNYIPEVLLTGYWSSIWNSTGFWGYDHHVASDGVWISLASDSSNGGGGYTIDKLKYSGPFYRDVSYTSPNYPGYPANYSGCQTIAAPTGATTVAVRFADFDFEQTSTSCWDSVRVSRPDDGQSRTYCGETSYAQPFWSHAVRGGSIKLCLSSDWLVTKRGYVVDRIMWY